MRPAVWQAKAAIASVLDGLGRTEEATVKRREARGVVDDIASSFEDRQMRDLYLETATKGL
jgi:hypothetical protein